MPDPTDICVIAPTLNEAANLRVLVPRIAGALAATRTVTSQAVSFEILIVDDNSQDGTPDVVAQLAREFPVRLLVRKHPRDGLSGAVLEGIRSTSSHYIVVMDADLQHPPEKIPELLAPLQRGEAEFVIGSRYAAGGSMEQSWGFFRRVNSWVATALAYPFSGRTHDPMSGFFALTRTTFDRAEHLTPLGYKIALELMCKARVRRVAEIPIHFGLREHGESKLTLKQQFKYLEHLSRLYDYTFPRFSPVMKFLIVTLIGWGVGLSVLQSIVSLGLREWWGVPLSYLGVILTTAVFHLRYVRTQREFLANRRPWGDFLLSVTVELLTCAGATLWLARRVPDVGAFELPVLAFAAATLVRYVLRKEFLLDLRGLRKDPSGDER